MRRMRETRIGTGNDGRPLHIFIRRGLGHLEEKKSKNKKRTDDIPLHSKENESMTPINARLPSA